MKKKLWIGLFRRKGEKWYAMTFLSPTKKEALRQSKEGGYEGRAIPVMLPVDKK
jgi:hypothetical protein